jgi:hypothetical protein
MLLNNNKKKNKLKGEKDHKKVKMIVREDKHQILRVEMAAY